MSPRLLPPLNPPVKDWRGMRVWIVGASSGIGEALARALGARGARLVLSARRRERLERVARDAQRSARPATLPARADAAPLPVVLPLDVTDADAVREAARRARAALDGLDLVLWVAGDYAPMRAWDLDLPAARRLLDVNLGGVLNGMAAVLPILLAQGTGRVALVSSVAGYRGLPKALAYGPTKAALINLAETLYMDLRPRGIGVHLVNPGFVATPLTAGNDFPMPALTSPDDAALAILRGIARGDFETHFPRRFTLFMKLLRLLPARLHFALAGRAA